MQADKKGKITGSATITVDKNDCDPDANECSTVNNVTFSTKFGKAAKKSIQIESAINVVIDPSTGIAIKGKGTSFVSGGIRYNGISGTISLGKTSGSPVDYLSCSTDIALK